MPTQRKRIGFLPRLEIQIIIDKISKHNKLSQSKVTGILVEEALNSRGILHSPLDKKDNYANAADERGLLINMDNLKNKKVYENKNFNLDKSYLNDEIQMINDYIEFKFFKNIMNKSKKNFKT